MKKILFLMIGLLVSIQAKSDQVNHAAGSGLQYGGIVGYQISSTDDKNNFRASLGLVGAAVGYDYLVTDKFSIGTTATWTLRNTYSANFNYYPSGLQKGWQFGLDLGYMPSDGRDGFFSSSRSRKVSWISIGYKF